MPRKKRVLIIDDHPLFREGLKAIVGRNDKFEVIAEAGNGEDGLLMAKDLVPDLIIMDISLPDTSGTELTHKIRMMLPDTRILVVSMHSHIDYIVEAFQAGASGYVVKESASSRLIQGLETVSDGEYYIDGSISHQVARKLMELPTREIKRTDMAYSSLTPREQEVLPLLAQGLSAKEIAEKLFISPKTVENHRASIMSKLGLHSAMDLVRYAAKFGLIDLDSWRE